MIRTPRAVIFDMDGIILDSEPVQLEAVNQILARYDIHWTQETFRHHIGLRSLDFFKNLKTLYPLREPIDELVAFHKETYCQLIQERIAQKKIQESKGLTSLLKELKGAEFHIGLATSSSRREVEIITRGLNIEKFFETFTCGEEVLEGKPAPEIFLKTAKALGVEPGQCVVIEDSPIGLQAAVQAGMRCVAIPTPSTHDGDFSKADLQLSSLQEVSVSLINSLLDK
jgi:HAD superfamily hydrolase (TIGR01509 family)